MKKVFLEGATFSQAIAQIELMDNINPKISSCIRLLTEEVYSMFYELLEKEKLNFSLERETSKFTMTFETKAWTDQETKEQFLEMSSNGKNDAYKGIKGFFKSILDSLILGTLAAADGGLREDDGYSEYNCYFSEMCGWKLSEYMATVPIEKVKAKWDGLEKSIIMNFADDVSVSIRDDMVKMALIKKI